MLKAKHDVTQPNFGTLSFGDRLHNVLLAGGEGKLEYGMLPLISQDLKDPDMSVVVIDTNGKLSKPASALAKLQNRHYVFFDPDSRNCPRFNPLLGPEEEVIADLIKVYSCWSCMSPPALKELSAEVITHALKVLKRLDKEEGVDGKYSNLSTLNQLLWDTNMHGSDMLMSLSLIPAKSQTEKKEREEIVSWFFNQYYREGSSIYEDTAGVRSIINRLCMDKSIKNVLALDAESVGQNDVDFDKCLDEHNVICISSANDILRGKSSFLGRLMLLRLQSTINRHAGFRLSLFVANPYLLVTSSMLSLLDDQRVAVHFSTNSLGVLTIGMSGPEGDAYMEKILHNMQNIAVFPDVSNNEAKKFCSILDAPPDILPIMISHQPYGSALCRFVKDGELTTPQFLNVKRLSPLNVFTLRKILG